MSDEDRVASFVASIASMLAKCRTHHSLLSTHYCVMEPRAHAGDAEAQQDQTGYKPVDHTLPPNNATQAAE